MDTQAKIEMDERAVKLANQIMDIVSVGQVLRKQHIYHCVFAALQEQDVSARKRAVEASIRELKSIYERA